jgi:molybdate transport system substrate-binding protein
MTIVRAVMAASLLLFAAAPARAAEKIAVAAAADLAFAMDEIATLFRKAHPGDEVDVIYGSSGKIHAQIREGAPFDIFFSADVGFAESLKKEGLAASEPKLYATGRIVLWSPTHDVSKLSLKNLDDANFERIAIANPKHAPYGKRAEEALRAIGLWDKVREKLVFGENIAQTTQFVQSGGADVGIISLSLATAPQLSTKGRFALIPDDLHAPLEQAFVVTKHGAESSLARSFAKFMETPEARKIMIRFGFALPGERTAKR